MHNAQLFFNYEFHELLFQQRIKRIKRIFHYEFYELYELFFQQRIFSMHMHNYRKEEIKALSRWNSYNSYNS